MTVYYNGIGLVNRAIVAPSRRTKTQSDTDDDTRSFKSGVSNVDSGRSSPTSCMPLAVHDAGPRGDESPLVQASQLETASSTVGASGSNQIPVIPFSKGRTQEIKVEDGKEMQCTGVDKALPDAAAYGQYPWLLRFINQATEARYLAIALSTNIPVRFRMRSELSTVTNDACRCAE